MKLARALHAGVGGLLMRLEAGQGKMEGEAREVDVVQDTASTRFAKAGPGGPPAHWVEFVRRHAPQYLQPPYGQHAPRFGLGATLSEDNEVQDAASTRFAKAGLGGPPAHWVELVRRHAPQFLQPLSGQRVPGSGLDATLSEDNEQTVASDSGGPLRDEQTAPPDSGQKPLRAAKREPVSASERRVRRTRVPPAPDIRSPSKKERSVTAERAQPHGAPARCYRDSSTDRPPVQASRPAPRQEPAIGPAARPPRRPEGKRAPLSRRGSVGPKEGADVRQPPSGSDAHDMPCRPAQVRSRVSRSTGQRRGSIDAVPEQGRVAPAPMADAPSGAHGVKQGVTPVPDVIKAATHISPQAESSGAPAAGELLGTPSSSATKPIARRALPATGDAESRFLQAEPEWPRLPDEREEDRESQRIGADRWPSLPECAWDPGARLSPSEALLAASEDRRTRLRRQRRDLEQRGELWSA